MIKCSTAELYNLAHDCHRWHSIVPVTISQTRQEPYRPTELLACSLNSISHSSIHFSMMMGMIKHIRFLKVSCTLHTSILVCLYKAQYQCCSLSLFQTIFFWVFFNASTVIVFCISPTSCTYFQDMKLENGNVLKPYFQKMCGKSRFILTDRVHNHCDSSSHLVKSEFASQNYQVFSISKLSPSCYGFQWLLLAATTGEI